MTAAPALAPRPAIEVQRKTGPANLPALTGFRFFLALWVILHHLTGPAQTLGIAAMRLPNPIYLMIRGGYLAVTTFFVLSGFVLAHSYANARWDRRGLRRYAVSRFARIYPVYVVSLCIVAPFIRDDRTPAKGFYLFLHGILVQGWLGTLPVNWNTPAWSLSCELFFYLLFPAALVLAGRGGWSGTLALAAGATCLTRVLWAAGVADSVKPLIHLSDFLMGIAAARAYVLVRRRFTTANGAWFYLPAGAAFVALISFPRILPGFIDQTTALRPLNALMLIGFALGHGPVARALSGGVLVYLGKASYSMYILHVPVMWWYLRWSKEFSATVYIAQVIAVSSLIYSTVEEPVNGWLRRRLG